MLAMKRHVSTPAAVFWNAMIAVQMEYQTSEEIKIARRPKRSATKPKPMQPTNIPAKVQKTKNPMPLIEKRFAALLVNIPVATRPGAM